MKGPENAFCVAHLTLYLKWYLKPEPCHIICYKFEQKFGSKASFRYYDKFSLLIYTQH